MTNQFNGAVQVSPDRVRSALNNFIDIYRQSNGKIKESKQYLVKNNQYKLNSFQRWWYGSKHELEQGEDVYKFKMMCRWHKDCKHTSMLDDYLLNLVDLGLITQEEYEDNAKMFSWFRTCYRYLKAMLDCGQPIYVNPSQARFINEYYKEGIE